MYSVWCGICRILICIRPCYFIFYTDIQSLKWQIYFLLDPRALVEVLRTTAISKFSRNILWYYWMPVWSKIEQNFPKFILDFKHKKVNILGVMFCLLLIMIWNIDISRSSHTHLLSLSLWRLANTSLQLFTIPCKSDASMIILSRLGRDVLLRMLIFLGLLYFLSVIRFFYFKNIFQSYSHIRLNLF